MILSTAPKLAWRLVTHDLGRLSASAAGVAFAALLVFVQLGFRNSLLDSSLALLNMLDADVFVLHRMKEPFLQPQWEPRARLFQAASAQGVATSRSLLFEILYWKNLATGGQRPVRVIGVNPEQAPFVSADLNRAINGLSMADTALVDRRSRASLGRLTLGTAQIDRHELRVVGSFELGTDILADGHVIVNEETFLRLAPWRVDTTEVILLKLRPGARAVDVARELNGRLPGDVLVFTRAQLIERDWEFWKRGTPISILVTIGMSMGFLIGLGICYQILYIDIADHLAEFATIKAIGYGAGYLVTVVVVEALILALVGFLPSLILAQGIYFVLSGLTGLVVRLTLVRVLLVFSITVGMCVLAAALAVFRALTADPAELF
ncbi:MAG: hypothetical protein MUF51_03290 [Vicinamibacteria bacterium]|nr:hypothetical protein [Vicinamibacteria bacterium]